MLLWGFLLALPVGFGMAILWGICRRLVPQQRIFNKGVLVGGVFTYFGTYFFLIVPPPHLLDYLLQQAPLIMRALQCIGLRSTVQDPYYLSDALRMLGWLFILGWVVGAGVTLLIKQQPFEPYSSEDS